MGIACSGKTFIAKRLLKEISAFYIDKDSIMDPFTKERSGDFYDRIRGPSYKAMYNIALDNLKLGNSVVIDSPHVKEMQDRKWREWLKEFSSPFVLKIILCHAPEDVIKKRLIERGEEKDEEKLKNWKEFLKKEPIIPEMPFDHIKIDTSKDQEDKIKNVLLYLDK